MSSTIEARDLSPLPGELSADDEDWLSRVQRHLASDYVLRFGDAEVEDDGEDFLVRRDAYGQWWAGRYVGELSYDGRRLRIRPRLGEVVFEQWLSEVLNLVAVPQSSAPRQSESFIARLMGAVWCRAVDEACRHGPPAFRREHLHEGATVRGRLDVRGSMRLRARGGFHVASVERYRDLDNDVARTLVAAERALSARIGHDRWLTPRAEQILPLLRAAVGARPRLPPKRALVRIRYTPITRPFRAVADLSWRLAHLQGDGASTEDGASEGLFVDIAELWELFVLKAVARAFPSHLVEHGTRTGQTTWLMTSQISPGVGLGRLKPDVLVSDADGALLVADAKYKRLANRWPERPQGIDRADLYQLTSYLARHSPNGRAAGVLLFPRSDDDAGQSATAETKGPWVLESRATVHFARLSTGLAEAVVDLRELLPKLMPIEPPPPPPTKMVSA